MAGKAAIVNTAGPGEHSAFDGAVLSRASGQILTLGLLVREMVYDVYPETVEVVWPQQGSVGWGIGPKKFSDQFCYFLAFKKHVTLGFYYGGELPDPDGVLGGGGPQVTGRLSMRSVRIATAEELRRPQIRALVEAAVANLQAR